MKGFNKCPLLIVTYLGAMLAITKTVTGVPIVMEDFST